MRAVVVLLVRIVLERDHLVLGEPPGALKVQIVAPGARAVHLAASVGRVSDPRPLAGTGDTFEATFEAPSERYPQVAVLGAWDEAGGVAIAVLLLWGAARLPVQVDAPQANITLVVGGRRFGGIADGHGRAEIAFVAPPGLRNGTVSAIDRLGNMRHREVPLGIPDAPRLLIEGGPDELLADGRTATRLVCFGATPEAQPEPALRVRAPGAEVRPLGVGIAEVIVPPRRDLGPVTVTAEACGSSTGRPPRPGP